MSKLPDRFEDWTPPWKAKGEALDEDQAARLIYNVTKEREREEDAHAATKETLSTVTGEKDSLLVENTALKADTSIDDLKRENAELKAAAETASQNARKVMLDAVKNEFGLTDKQVSKLEGDDLEALRTDAKDTFGEPKGEKEEPGEEGEKEVLGGPRQTGRAKNAGDPNEAERTRTPSRDEVLASIPD